MNHARLDLRDALPDERALLVAIETSLETTLGPDRAGLAGSPLLGAARRLCLAGGKRVRPRLVAAFGRALGASAPVVLEPAVAAELLHAASLLHDDVIDDGRLRRGVPTANVVWGNTVAVLAGDLLVSLALERLRRWPTLCASAVRVVTVMTEASMRELEARRRIDLLPADWRAIAEGKTGELFGWCCAAAARWAGDDDAVERFTRCGRHLGVAFQLADDLLDLRADDKDALADLRTGNPSHVLLVAAQRAPRLRERLSELWRVAIGEEAELRACAELVAGSGAVEATRRAIADELDQARAALGPHQAHPAIARVLGWAEALWGSLEAGTHEEGPCAAT